MKSSFSPKNNPRVIIIQKLYGKFFNDDEELIFPKHRFKKFIKDIVTGTIERNELIIDINLLNKDEKIWLNQYHKSVFYNLKGSMNSIEMEDLKKACSAI